MVNSLFLSQEGNNIPVHAKNVMVKKKPGFPILIN